MKVRVWSPDAGILIRLKVEDSNDNTHTCETQLTSTVAGGWETLVFDFTNQAPGTELLSVGLSMGWTYNMASIFFNFDVDGATAGEKTYYFDDVSFGGSVGITEEELINIQVYPNPAVDRWTIASDATINQLDLYDTMGRMVRSIEVKDGLVTLDASALASGTYLLRIHTEDGIQLRQLIKE